MRRISLAVAACSALLFAACGGSSEQSSDETANTAPLPEEDPAGAGEASAPAGGTGGAAEAGTAPAGEEGAAAGAGSAEVTAEEREALDRMIELMVGFADELTAAGDDCDKIAETLNGFVKDNKAELETLGEKLKKAPAAKQQKMQQEMQKAIGPKMQEAFSGMMACQEHEGVKKGLQKMQTIQ